MSWVDQLAEAVGWGPLGLGIEWAEIESRIGSPLPADYKEFCRVFGQGEFSGYLTVYASQGGDGSEVVDSLETNQRIAERHPVVLDGYLPYGLYRIAGQGVLQWGASSTGCEFAWLADSSIPPDTWPVLARDDASPWLRYDKLMSEFAYRLVADESFERFGVGGVVDPPFFSPQP